MSTAYRPFSIDLGNRFLKYRSGTQQPEIMLSVMAEVLADSRPNLDPKTSADILYLEGKPEYEGKRWIVGESARETPGYTNTVSLQNKVEEALRLVLATLAPASAKETEMVIDPLYITVPDAERDQSLASAGLVGTHRILRNQQAMSVTFNRVVVCAEAAAGYRYAIQKKVLVPGRLNGVLDIGGGTAIGALFNGKGQEIQDARAVFRKSGAFALATRIAAAPEMKQAARGAAAIDKLLDGIARRDYLYGATGVSFKQLFDAHHPLWLKNLMNEVVSRWDGYLDDVANIAIIGGSAPLAAPLVKGAKNKWFRLCPNPQFANVLGLAQAERELTAPGAGR
ncbi:ParM/StbA family protein (plasmid) [Kovacikia minuta CCNUW1]|uniref:ParM/StbA family protein n=1 Tax=Kovacikia minuta TaxID=2931930 RepID=UPI001CD0059B|nr:ParM/StbA family protein [Kovacikia minuta]UBF30161.1 ParM/StbA family protein [Kovacikia minuta CCNUW1]